MTTQGERVWRNFVGNEFIEGIDQFASTSPVDGTTVSMVHEAGADQIDAAVQAARSAVEGEYSRFSNADRVELLRRIADLLDDRVEDFIEAEQSDTGKPITWARTFEVPRAAANFRSFADGIAAHGETLYHTDGPGRASLNYVQRRPLGVVAAIAPWNLPLLLLTWKVAPALAAGNAVIAKPSEETPATATMLAEVIRDAGAPAGLYNVVHGFGPNSAGELLTRHPGIDAVTFTGESATGSAIMSAVADRLLPLSFELGGKNAGLIFADADVDEAVEGTVRSAFANSGQVCLNTERLYVQAPIFDEFVDKLAKRAAELRFGWPTDPTTEIGPLISTAHRDRVLCMMEQAVAEGAQLVAGGGVPEFGDRRDRGSWIEPTVWTGLDNQASTLRNEIFGPVCHVAAFDDADEAVSLANDSDYGLAATLWTNDLRQAHNVAGQLRAGLIWVNTWFLRDLRAPFGGMGRSGIGREGGTWSLDYYTEASNVCIKL